MGVKFAEDVAGTHNQRVVLNTFRFNPYTFPNWNDSDRLDLARRVGRSTFGLAVRHDDLLHLILDVLERDKSLTA